MEETENDTLLCILNENKILKGKLKGFMTLDKMFKDVKEKNKELENEISFLKEDQFSKMITPSSLTDDPDSSLENMMKKVDEKEPYSIEHEYKLPSPKISLLENMSIAEELRTILDRKSTNFQDTTKLAEELKKLSNSISEMEEKRQHDLEIVRVLTKELKKCKSERELLKRENEQFMKQFQELQTKGGEKEKWVVLDDDFLENSSDEWKNMYFALKKKFDKDVTDLRKILESKNREINQLQNTQAKEKAILTKEIADLRKKLTLKFMTDKSTPQKDLYSEFKGMKLNIESRSNVKSEEEDMISQQMQIFQEDFKVEHQERMKAQAAKIELEKKCDAMKKEFEEKSNLFANSDRRLKYYKEKCELLSKENVLIKNELDLVQENMKRASEFMAYIPTPRKTLQEAEKHQKRIDRISTILMNNDEQTSLDEIANWQCPSCTFQNKAWTYNCIICKSQKPGFVHLPSTLYIDSVVENPPSFSVLDYDEDSK